MFRKFLMSAFVAALACQSAIGQDELVPPPVAANVAPTMYHSGWAGIVDGKMAGEVVSLADLNAGAGAKVSLLKAGQVVKTVEANSEGAFEMADVTPGVYGLIVESDKVFGAFSFEALSVSSGDMNPVQVYATMMPKAEVDGLWSSLWAPSDMQGHAVSFENLSPATLKVVQTPKVRMHSGRVNGQVAFENPGAIPNSHVVKVYKGGALISTQRVDEMGEFSFAVDSPGLIDVVVGGGAYACISAEVVGEAEGFSGTRKGGFFVAAEIAQAASDTLLVPAIGPAPVSNVVEQPVVNDLPIADFGAPIMGGGAPGGFAGGGGGFGGGGAGGGFGGGIGGLGGLLGIAGLAVGVTALSDDDGFNNNVGTVIQ